MPHVVLTALEPELAGRESRQIAGLTEAVVSVYGTWATGAVDVKLVGVHPGRWGRGGGVVASAAPTITFGMREEVFARPNASDVVARLKAAFTEAVVDEFGEACRSEVLVELVGQPTSRSGLGGQIIG